MKIEIHDPASARELLKDLQAEQTHDCWYPTIPADDAFYESNARRIGGWIQQIDEMRPLNAAGEHVVHTPNCGCETTLHMVTSECGAPTFRMTAYTCKCYLRHDHSVDAV